MRRLRWGAPTLPPARLAAWSFLVAAQFGAAVPLRQALLDLARNRINVWYADDSHLEDPKTQDGVTWRLSKEDKACGGDGVPLTFVEFTIEGVRPIDAFNVIVDSPNEPSWDSVCDSFEFLGDLKHLQARGYAGVFISKPFPSREAYEWQVADANFSTEEFWVVFSTLQNDELKQRKPPKSGSVQMENCLAAYRITKVPGGAHVVMTQQLNTHPFPLKARDVAEMGWTASVTFADQHRAASQAQAKLGWNSTRTMLPEWMLKNGPCEAPAPDTELQQPLLARAAAELSRPDRGAPLPPLERDGLSLQVWRRDEACGGSGLSAQSVPRWHAEFEVPGAGPKEVFNALVNKRAEARWNKAMVQVNASGFHGGARSVHEAFQPPPVFGRVWASRELWEWQAVSHDLAHSSYLVAITSAAEPSSPKFTKQSVPAQQCLATYEVSRTRSPGATGGEAALVRMSLHTNPNLGSLQVLGKLWRTAGERMLLDFAVALAEEARRLRGLRGKGATSAAAVDGDALTLLAPPPPDRNSSVPLASVLTAGPHDWKRVFASLSLPDVLDASRWPPAEFANRTNDILRLFHLVAHNASATEASAFHNGRAADAFAVQQQGEALMALQYRVLQNVSCANGPSIPDINGDKGSGGLSLLILGGIVLGLLLIIIPLCACWCCRCRRLWRQRRAAAAAEALLLGEPPATEAGVHRPPQPPTAQPNSLGIPVLAVPTVKPEEPESGEPHTFMTDSTRASSSHTVTLAQ